MLCRQVQKIEKQAFEPKDMKGEFAGTKTYLQRLAGIQMSRKTGWQQIDALRQIRNKLAHEGGFVRRDDANFRELVQRTPGVEVDDQDMVTPTSQFLLDAIATIRTFLREVVNDLKAKYHD